MLWKPENKRCSGEGGDGAIYHHEGERFGKKAGKSTLQRQWDPKKNLI